MARKVKLFEVFGVNYRSKQFSAVDALALIDSKEIHPTQKLSLTEVLSENKGWLTLDNYEVINEYVKDPAKVIPPRMVLDVLIRVVNDHSFSAFENWKGIKIPSRFTSEGERKESKHVPSLISSLIQYDYSLRELEEYYSLEDALSLLDVMTAKGINESLAHEAATKKKR